IRDIFPAGAGARPTHDSHGGDTMSGDDDRMAPQSPPAPHGTAPSMKPVLIIPAAGSGTRLHAAIPKVLFPVNGKPMIDYVLPLYAPVVAQFILVLQPAVAHAVQRHCRRHALPIEYALQDVPTGMLDALLIPQERVRCSPWT